jgi:hypothetical protein
MSQQKTAELIASIKAAFATRVYPGDDQLVDDLDDLESAEIAEAFRGLHWSEPSPEMLEHNNSALNFFSDAAWRYYVPAFMLVVLEHSDKIDMVDFSLIFSLLPPIVWAERRLAEEAKGLPPIEALGLSPEETERLRTVREQSIEMAERKRDRAAEAAWDARRQAEFESRMGGLTAQEKAVIREFLEYLQEQSPEDDDMRLALERYWQRF